MKQKTRTRAFCALLLAVLVTMPLIPACSDDADASLKIEMGYGFWAGLTRDVIENSLKVDLTYNRELECWETNSVLMGFHSFNADVYRLYFREDGTIDEIVGVVYNPSNMLLNDMKKMIRFSFKIVGSKVFSSPTGETTYAWKLERTMMGGDVVMLVDLRPNYNELWMP